MFSVQPENAVASYSSSRQRAGRADQSPASGEFGALVDSNANAADTARSPSTQSDGPVRRDEPQPSKTRAADGTADTRPAKQDNSDQNSGVTDGKAKVQADSKDGVDKPDSAKKAASGKTKEAQDTKDSADAVVADQANATDASAANATTPVAVVVINAANPASAVMTNGETAATTAPAIAAAAATNASSAAGKAEIATGAATETTQSAPSVPQTSTQSLADTATAAAQAATGNGSTGKAAAETTATVASKSNDGGSGTIAEDSSAQQLLALNGVTPDAALQTGVALTTQTAANGPVPSVSNGKTAITSATKNAALTNADAKDEAPQTASAGKSKDAKPASTAHAGKPDADHPDAESVKESKGAETGDAKTASPDKPAPAVHEPRIAAQHLAADPSLQQINTQQQPTTLQPSNAAPAPTAQLNATLAAANMPVPLNSLAADIALKAAGGNSRFEIRLDPAELGRIDVRLDVDKHGQVTSHLTVERPATLDMLRKDAPQLQQALEDAGLKTSNGGLQFSLRDQSSFAGRQDDGQSGRNSQRLIITEDTPVPAQIAGQSYGRALGSRSGVDISI